MIELRAFDRFIDELRRGRPEAAGEYVEHYGPVVRLELHLHLGDPTAVQNLEDLGASRTVIDAFTFRYRLGQFDVDSPADLIDYLRKMTRGFVADMFERATAHDANSAPLVGNPSKEECEIILLRRQGKSWPEVAAITGRSPDSCRRHLGRVITHLARLMKLPDVAFDDG